MTPLANYDHSIVCLSNAPTYGATLARVDNFDDKQSAIGSSVAVQEYFILTAFATELGFFLWRHVPGLTDLEAELIVTRAAKVVQAAPLLPAHRKPVHPSSHAALRLFLCLLHPQRIAQVWLALRTGSIPNLRAESQLTIHGFSAGSLNGLALHCIAHDFLPAFQGVTSVGALACTYDLITAHCRKKKRTLKVVHYEDDQLCVWHPKKNDLHSLHHEGILVTLITHGEEDQKEVDWVGKHRHGYGHLAGMELDPGSFSWQQLETTVVGVTSEAVYNTGPRKLLAWCMLDTPSEEQGFLADLANAYGKLQGDPLGVASQQRGLKSEALHAFLLGLVEVRLQHASGNNVHVKDVVSAMLKDTPCHMLSYLLDYFLCQLKVGDWYVLPPYQASPKVALQWWEGGPPITVHARLLRHGCLGTFYSWILRWKKLLLFCCACVKAVLCLP